jgi:hypothetical protein
MQEFLYFWQNIFFHPIDTIYDYHTESQGDINRVGLIHFFIGITLTAIMFGIENVKNNPFLSFSGILYYFIVGSILGMAIFFMYNFILTISLKLIFIILNLEGQNYTIINLVLLSNFVFALNVFSIITTYNLNGFSIFLFLLTTITQSFLLEEEYYRKLIYKYITSFILSFISFSLLSYIFFTVLNSFI